MSGASSLRTLKFVIPGVGAGFLLMGGWDWYAVPPPVPCVGPLTCTQVFIPGGLVAAVLLTLGGMLTLGWGLVVGSYALMRRLVVGPNPGIANRLRRP